MLKHDNLKKLHTKLQGRYGELDDLVLQLTRELETRGVNECHSGPFSIPYTDFIRTALASVGRAPMSRRAH